MTSRTPDAACCHSDDAGHVAAFCALSLADQVAWLRSMADRYAAAGMPDLADAARVEATYIDLASLQARQGLPAGQ